LKPDFIDNHINNLMTSFFSGKVTADKVIPIGLQDALNRSGMLKDCVAKGYITIKK
jgi:hypothetical protein